MRILNEFLSKDGETLYQVLFSEDELLENTGAVLGGTGIGVGVGYRIGKKKSKKIQEKADKLNDVVERNRKSKIEEIANTWESKISKEDKKILEEKIQKRKNVQKSIMNGGGGLTGKQKVDNMVKAVNDELSFRSGLRDGIIKKDINSINQYASGKSQKIFKVSKKMKKAAKNKALLKGGIIGVGTGLGLAGANHIYKSKNKTTK